jgi:hypothetical protein
LPPLPLLLPELDELLDEELLEEFEELDDEGGVYEEPSELPKDRRRLLPASREEFR